jgi:DNA-directed RNA polymerase specialized sigma24 family protein
MAKLPDDDRAERPLADEEIVRRLAREHFDPKGPTWRILSETLIAYGYSVFKGWLMTGAVYRAAASHGSAGIRGLARIPKDLKLREDDAHDLTATLLTTAIARFRRTLQDGGWRPNGGASLRTFFVGRCLMELPDVYERWRRQQDRWAREVTDVSGVDDGRFSADPADAAVASVHLDELLPPTEYEHVRVMLTLAQSGYTVAEISCLFTEAGIPYSEATVRTRISRTRAKVRKQQDRSERGDLDER